MTRTINYRDRHFKQSKETCDVAHILQLKIDTAFHRERLFNVRCSPCLRSNSSVVMRAACA